MPPSRLDKDREDKTRAELRGTIAREAGKRTRWDTPLDKETLNTVYAYLTGEYVVPKRALYKPDHPDHESRRVIALYVAEEVRLWGDDSEPYNYPSRKHVLPFNRDELVQIREAMKAIDGDPFREDDGE